MPRPKLSPLSAAIAAVQVCCDEEQWLITDINCLNPLSPIFTLIAYGETISLRGSTAPFDKPVSDEAIALVALQFRDTVIETVAWIKETRRGFSD